MWCRDRTGVELLPGGNKRHPERAGKYPLACPAPGTDRQASLLCAPRFAGMVFTGEESQNSGKGAATGLEGWPGFAKDRPHPD